MGKPKQLEDKPQPRMIKTLITQVPEPVPDGTVDYFFVHGSPKLRFIVQEKSEAWLQLKGMERSGEIKAAYPRSPVARAVTGLTREILNEMMYSFDELGHFKTRDPQLAIAAFKASYNFNGCSKDLTYVDGQSQPLPKDVLTEVTKKMVTQVRFKDEQGFATSRSEVQEKQ